MTRHHFIHLFAVRLLCSLMLLSLPGTLLAAQWQSFAPVQQALQGSQPATDGLTLDLPLVSEDGSAVPLSVTFSANLPQGDSLKSLRIFSTGNPNPEVIDFIFHDPGVVADLSTRIRLNESQTVIALATSESGKTWITEREVRVTVSGCLMRSDEQADGGMQNPRIALPRRLQANQVIEIRTLINHPMETGLRRNSEGVLLPQNLIKNMQLLLDQQPALEARFYTGTSANPYVRLNLKLAASSKAAFIWQDQQGQNLIEQRELQL